MRRTKRYGMRSYRKRYGGRAGVSATGYTPRRRATAASQVTRKVVLRKEVRFHFNQTGTNTSSDYYLNRAADGYYYLGEDYTLAEFDLSSNFTNNFDQWRFKNVKLTFYPPCEVNNASNIYVPAQVTMHITNDFDDATPPTSLDQINNRSGYRKYQILPGRKRTWNVTPNAAAGVTNSSGTQTSGGFYKGFLNTSGTGSIPFYGTKYAFYVKNSDGGDFTDDYVMDVTYEATLIGRGLTQLS